MEEVEKPLEQDPSTSSEETDAPAQSSSADGESDESLLDVVTSALHDQGSYSEEEKLVSESPTGQEDVKQEEGNADYDASATDKSVDEEAYSDVPFHEHPRFKKLIAERNELRKAGDQHNALTGWLRDNNLSADEAVEAFRVAATMKNDPGAAYSMLKGHLDTLSVSTGHTLPEDIQTKVDDGYLDEDSATELSRARAEAAHEKQMREQMQNQTQLQHAQAQHGHLAQTVDDWESITRQSDPDYSLKQPEIDDRVRVLISERGRPASSEQALQMAQEAYEVVNQRYRARQPEIQPIRTATGGKLGGTPSPEPKNVMDAVNLGLAKL